MVARGNSGKDASGESFGERHPILQEGRAFRQAREEARPDVHTTDKFELTTLKQLHIYGEVLAEGVRTRRYRAITGILRSI